VETREEIIDPTVDQVHAYFTLLRGQYKEQWYDLLNSIRFAELRGGGYLAYLAEVLDDPNMMAKMTKHAADESKHAHFVNLMIRREGGTLRSMRERNLFRSMSEARGDGEGGPPLHECPSREDLIEVFASMQAIEISAKTAFQAFERVFADDEVILTMVREVLKDEEFHIGWIAKILDRWREEGNAERIDDAVYRARLALARARQQTVAPGTADQN
jgi:rubrerythrin